MTSPPHALILPFAILVGLTAYAGSAATDSTAGSVVRPTPRWRLSYSIPPGWIADRGEAKRMSLTALLRPREMQMRDAPALIAIDFKSKSGNPLAPRTLEQFFKAEMRQLLIAFPDLIHTTWVPDSLSDVVPEVATIEIRGIQPGPLRVAMIDVGDGYYSIQLSVRGGAEILDRRDVESFFKSLLLLPLG